MKTRILLCAGLLAMGATTTLGSNRVTAKGLTQNEHLVPKNAIVSERNAEYYKRLGNAKYDRGNFQGAIADYNRAIELDSNFAIAYSNRGNARNKLGDYSGAIADHNQALKINPNYDAAYNNRGVVKFKLGDYSGARADFNRALKINPNCADARNNLEEIDVAARKSQEQRTLNQINRVRNAGTCCR